MYSTIIDNRAIHIALYKSIKNLQELRKQLDLGELECCLIKAALIPSPFVLALSAHKAITSSKIITNSISSEILFNLSLTRNITSSLQQLMATEEDEYVIVLVFDKKCFSLIEGEEVDLSKLKCICDQTTIQKMYALNDYEVNNCLIESICNKVLVKDL